MLIAGILAAAILWWLMKSAVKANPKKLAALIRKGGGALAFLAAAVLLVRGRFDMAFLLGGTGAWLFGWAGVPIPGLRGLGGPKKKSGSVSRVRSAMIEMELDHDSGLMRGQVLVGAFQGRNLDELGPPELRQLLDACRQQDPDGDRLLEAYLDRRFTGWREDAERDRHARARPDPQSGAMTQEEAHQVLGLEPGAQPEAIRRAHRDLMKKLHPDQGGSTYLASRVNQAKDVLLNRHR